MSSLALVVVAAMVLVGLFYLTHRHPSLTGTRSGVRAGRRPLPTTVSRR
ncbi:hypothetical protein ABT097_32875 [Streptomyces sp. NPDC002225]